MTDQIKEMLDARPFQPFKIILTSGDHYEVTDPSMVAIARTYIFYCYPRSDQSAHLRLNQIAAVETVKPAA